ncbi:DUF202 domain-containing protein [Mycobacterium palustre]|uniref:DUF202 domain-containing protein n=1 Tax=Mycobacterium palustre TaxID=153971 RepID=A0A1X1ZTQ4_9MYCO|nr:DUF202 domain-containing protein [Mycobacterium palustre]MCV7102659.1 DUF202 domain-containing protein [Mycobacterium palustre]ORW26742.1 hypothetical protein AWC19_03410 [Mycobacterium palustre]
MSDRANDPADRTTLAWTRTSFAFLGNGALLTIRNLHGPLRATEVIPAVLAAAVAVGTYLMALQRQHNLQCDPHPARITPRRQVYVLGISVLVLIVATMIGQVF